MIETIQNNCQIIQPPMTPGYIVLYAEDDIDDLTTISEALVEHIKQLRVIHAQNGIEALQILEKMSQQMQLPCLIILDINMPLKDGRQTLAEIKKSKEYENIPVVMVSTSNSKADRKFAEDMGASFFTKPYTHIDLQKMVETLVQKCALEKKSLIL